MCSFKILIRYRNCFTRGTLIKCLSLYFGDRDLSSSKQPEWSPTSSSRSSRKVSSTYLPTRWYSRDLTIDIHGEWPCRSRREESGGIRVKITLDGELKPKAESGWKYCGLKEPPCCGINGQWFTISRTPSSADRLINNANTRKFRWLHHSKVGELCSDGEEKSLKMKFVFLCIHHCILIANGPTYLTYMTDMWYSC